MNGFPVREALGFSEFNEALIRLCGEKNGIKQSDKGFDLPDEAEEWPWGYDDGAKDDDDDDGAPTAAPLGKGQESPARAAVMVLLAIPLVLLS